MKKHFLRLFAALAVACLGFGVLAACGDPETPGPSGGSGPSGDPGTTDTTDPIEGVWTGAEALDTTFTATVKVVEEQAFAVIEAVYDEEIYGIYGKVLDKQTDGTYKLTETSGEDVLTYTGALNAQNNLVITIPGSLMGEDGDVTLTFTQKAALPAALGLAGTYYGTVVNTDFEADFTAKTVKINGDDASSVYTVNFTDVGAYTVITMKDEAPSEGLPGFVNILTVCKVGEKYLAYGVPSATEPFALSKTRPVLEGVWTGASRQVGGGSDGVTDMGYFTASVKLSTDKNTAYVVIKQENKAIAADGTVQETLPTFYQYSAFTKTSNGNYQNTQTVSMGPGSTMEVTATLGFNAMGELTISNNMTGGFTFDARTDLPAELALTGVKYAQGTAETEDADQYWEIDFTNSTVKPNGAALSEYDLAVEFVKVGEYIVLNFTKTSDEAELDTALPYMVVYAQTAETVTTYYIQGTMLGNQTPLALGDTAPVPTPADMHITFEAGAQDSKIAGLPAAATAPAGAYTIPDQEPARPGYTFAGWKVGEDTTVYKKGTANATYTVVQDTDVTFTAQWTAVTYTLNFYDDEEDETATAVTVEGQEAVGSKLPTATKQYYTFVKWVLDGETEVDASFAPYENTAKATEDTVFNIYGKWKVVIGADGNTSEYPTHTGTAGDGLQWVGTIEKGNRYTFRGTETNNTDNNAFGLKTYIYSGAQPAGLFRVDNAIDDGQTWEQGQFNGGLLAEAENWVLNKFSSTGFGGSGDPLYKAAMNGAIVVDIDWVDASIITVKIAITAATGAANGYFEQFYTIEGATDHPLAQSYKLAFACEKAQVTFTEITTSQTAIQEVTVGDAGYRLGYTEKTPAWYGKSFKQGGTVTIAGTVKSSGNAGYLVPVAYIMSDKKANGSILRTDGCSQFGNYEGEAFNVVPTAGITNADTNYYVDSGGAASNADTDFLNAIKEGVTFTLTYDWTQAKTITVTARFEKGTMTRTTTFTITPTAENFAHDAYYVGLGGEGIFLQVTSIVYANA